MRLFGGLITKLLFPWQPHDFYISVPLGLYGSTLLFGNTVTLDSRLGGREGCRS